MKTKFLFSTMALATVFAGCSNEQFIENVTNPSDLGNRRTAGQVTVDFGGASSRMEMDEYGVIKFVKTDKIGAALMDEFNGQYPVTKFVNYAQTNYPFVTDGDNTNIWKSTGVLLEGNYFFTYPFNACNQVRETITNTVPVDQYAYGEDGVFNPMQSYIDNQFYVGYKYIHAAEECENCDEVPHINLGVKLEKVHAYPVFHLTNVTGIPDDKPFVIYKASLRQQDGGMFYNKIALTPASFGFMADPDGDIYAAQKNDYNLWESVMTNPNWKDSYPSAPSDVMVELKKSQTIEYNVIFPENFTLKNWDDFEFSMVVPAGYYGPMELVLYTSEGIGTYPVFNGVGEDYLVDSGTYRLTPDKKSTTSIKFDITSLRNNSIDFTVQSTENFVEHLRYIKDLGNETTVHVTTVGDKVELSEEAYNIIQNKNIKLNLTGTLVIPANVPENAIDCITSYDNKAVIINNGTQKVTVQPTCEDYSISSVTIVNNNNLTVASDLISTRILNNGLVSVDESCSIFDVMNLENATFEVNKELNVMHMFNAGVFNVKADAQLNVMSAFYNVKSFTNDGIVNIYPMRNKDIQAYSIRDMFEVPGGFDYTIVDLYSVALESDASAINVGTIDNNGIFDAKGSIVKEYLLKWEEIFGESFAINIESDKASVSSLVNVNGNIKNSGDMSNVSNYGYLTPMPESNTSLVLLKENNGLIEWDRFYNAIKLHFQLGLINEYGFIDMTENDKVASSDQALITDNTNNVAIDKDAYHQIIYVARTSEVDLRTKVTEDTKSAPKYINTIWLYNVSGTIKENINISNYNLWLSNNNEIKITNPYSLTLGPVSIDGTSKFDGDGTFLLSNDVYLNEGAKIRVYNTWKSVDGSIKYIHATQGNILYNAGLKDESIEVTGSLEDYFGPWYIVK